MLKALVHHQIASKLNTTIPGNFQSIIQIVLDLCVHAHTSILVIGVGVLLEVIKHATLKQVYFKFTEWIITNGYVPIILPILVEGLRPKNIDGDETGMIAAKRIEILRCLTEMDPLFTVTQSVSYVIQRFQSADIFNQNSSLLICFETVFSIFTAEMMQSVSDPTIPSNIAFRTNLLNFFGSVLSMQQSTPESVFIQLKLVNSFLHLSKYGDTDFIPMILQVLLSYVAYPGDSITHLEIRRRSASTLCKLALSAPVSLEVITL